MECFKRYLDATSLHQGVKKVEVERAEILQDISAQRLAQRLRGQRLCAAHRHGKYLSVALQDGSCMVLHFGMTGFLKYARGDGNISPHARLVITFDNGYRLAYDSQRLIGNVRLADDFAHFLQTKKIGPDVLRLDRSAFAERLATRRGMIKSTLMNQSVVAGLGNLYTDEILFQARIHPRATVHELADETVARLFRQICRILEKAIDIRVDPARFPRSWLIAHRRPDAPCPRDNGHVRRITVSGRHAYYCPQCQQL